MTLREWSALLSTILAVVGGVWYIHQTLTSTRVKPVLASWIVLGGTMTLSFFTYWTTPNHSIVSNAANAAAVVNTMGILVVVAWVSMAHGNRITFSPFQKWSLKIAGLIAIFWIILVWGLGGTGVLPNILTQVLMLIGYIVTAEKLWRSTNNSEPLFTWWCVTLASLIAVYTAIVSHDLLAGIYATRATLASGTVVLLAYRAERKSRLLVPA